MRLRHLVSRGARQVWFRALMFSIAAVLLALIAGVVGQYLPAGFRVELGQGSLDSLLKLLAPAMLTVTTFSLTAMVAAYSAAASTGTPRATQLLLQDHTSQNALSTFLGSFVFSIVGIVALATGQYDENSRTVLFLGTLAVIGIIVITLLRWISYLTTMGRMADVIRRVERAATRTMRSFAESPQMGAAARVAIPETAEPVRADKIGYITRVDIAALNSVAEAEDLRIHVVTPPGSFADPGRSMAQVEGELDDAVAAVVRRAFTVETNRTYDQDPRLGLIALSEIASRALSAAVNDPGTAIQVLGSIERVMILALTSSVTDEPRYPRVHLWRPGVGDFLEDAYRPIARDGAAVIEVQLRLQRSLHALEASSATPLDRQLVREAAAEASERALRSLDTEPDRAALRAVAAHRDAG
ncbi:MAG: DUF2254 domain-containing protein [Propioniciclava sp.]